MYVFGFVCVWHSNTWSISDGFVCLKSLAIYVAAGAKDDWRAWEVNNQVAGYVTSYGGGSFSFATVKGAGHMVPQFQPVNAVEMFRRFINEEPL